MSTMDLIINFCSSLGQNLETSIYTWENIFAVFISIAGLLLVLLYLTTNLKVGAKSVILVIL